MLKQWLATLPTRRVLVIAIDPNADGLPIQRLARDEIARRAQNDDDHWARTVAPLLLAVGH